MGDTDIEPLTKKAGQLRCQMVSLRAKYRGLLFFHDIGSEQCRKDIHQQIRNLMLQLMPLVDRIARQCAKDCPNMPEPIMVSSIRTVYGITKNDLNTFDLEYSVA